MFDDLLVKLTHKELLHVLPFGCSYACDKEGEPCPTSVTIALMLQSIVALSNPSAFKASEEAN